MQRVHQPSRACLIVLSVLRVLACARHSGPRNSLCRIIDLGEGSHRRPCPAPCFIGPWMTADELVTASVPFSVISTSCDQQRYVVGPADGASPAGLPALPR